MSHANQNRIYHYICSIIPSQPLFPFFSQCYVFLFKIVDCTNFYKFFSPKVLRFNFFKTILQSLANLFNYSFRKVEHSSMNWSTPNKRFIPFSFIKNIYIILLYHFLAFPNESNNHSPVSVNYQASQSYHGHDKLNKSVGWIGVYFWSLFFTVRFCHLSVYSSFSHCLWLKPSSWAASGKSWKELLCWNYFTWSFCIIVFPTGHFAAYQYYSKDS